MLKICVFAFILFSIGSCEIFVEDSSNSSTSNSINSSSSSSLLESSSLESEEINYEGMRINPISASGDEGYIYRADGSIYKTLRKGNYYTELEDVAGYIIAFNDLPVNYYKDVKEVDSSSGYATSKAACYEEFSTSCRLSPGSYYSNYDYLPNTFSGTYCEVDIGYENYAIASSWGRGTRRILWGSSGIDAYGKDIPVLFYTDDHYSTFKEYGNYYQGWGNLFGNNVGAWQMMPTLS